MTETWACASGFTSVRNDIAYADEDFDMRTTNANQREARELQARHDTGFSQTARDIRAENARRAAAALATTPDREWLMRDVCSTPYATVIA